MAEYTGYSDEELIDKLREGNGEIQTECPHPSGDCLPFGGKEDIMDYILDKYKPLVRKRANALYLIGGDTDDLIQEGMIGLFKAVQGYKANQDASFYHFAKMCIERQMYTTVEASRRKKHAPLNSYISLYDDSGADGVALADVLMGGADENPEHLLIDKESVRQRLDEVLKHLSKMEKQVLGYMLEGFNYQQIAEKMGKSPKAIDNAIQRMKGKKMKIHVDNMEKL